MQENHALKDTPYIGRKSPFGNGGVFLWLVGYDLRYTIYDVSCELSYLVDSFFVMGLALFSCFLTLFS